jgi:hypothetical protein
MAKSKQSTPEPQPKYPSPMRTQFEDFSLRRFFSILFYRQKKGG